MGLKYSRKLYEAYDPVPAKLISIEMLGSVIITIFLFGGGWVGVNRAIAGNEKAITEVKAKQAEVERTVNEIKTDVALLVASQISVEKTADERASRQQQSINRILDILQRSFPGNGIH